MALTLRRRLAPPPHISAPAPPWPHDSSPGWRHLSLPSCFCTEYDTFLFVPLPLSLSLCFSARPVDTASSQDGPGRLFTDKTKPKNKKKTKRKKKCHNCEVWVIVCEWFPLSDHALISSRLQSLFQSIFPILSLIRITSCMFMITRPRSALHHPGVIPDAPLWIRPSASFSRFINT